MAHRLLFIALVTSVLTACPDDKRKLGESCIADGECASGLCFGECLDPDADPDADGVTSQVEVFFGLEPLNPDSDDDGRDDGVEMGGVTDISGSPPNADADAVIDALEPANVDTDGDCIGDELDPDNDAPDISPDHVEAHCAVVLTGVCAGEYSAVDLQCAWDGASFSWVRDDPACLYTAVTAYAADDVCDNGLDDDCDGLTDEGCAPPGCGVGEACDDGDPCTTADVCDGAGGCAGVAVDCSGSNTLCGIARCDVATGHFVVDQPAPDGTVCDDADACTTADVCTAGVCGGTTADCSSFDTACATAACDPANGTCSLLTPVADGTVCDDGDDCTTSDVCSVGTCGGDAVDCSASDTACATASCDPTDGACTVLTPVLDGSVCDDGDVCTTSDVCSAGTCGGSPLDCSGSDTICETASCDPTDGTCSVLTPVVDGTVCDDGDDCTTGDVCTTGTCAGGPLDCSGSDTACETASCDPTDGSCSVLTPVVDGTVCDDGNACTTETCQAGVCQGAPVDCDDGDACTTDSCDPGGGCLNECLAMNAITNQCSGSGVCKVLDCDPAWADLDGTFANGCEAPRRLVYVDGPNNSTVPDGSSANPWVTLGDALNPVNLQAGDAIIVQPGTYSEDPTVPAGFGHVAIRAQAGAVLQGLLDVNADNTFVEGLTIQPAGFALDASADNVTVRDVTVVGGPGVRGGIRIVGQEARVRNVAVSDILPDPGDGFPGAAVFVQGTCDVDGVVASNIRGPDGDTQDIAWEGYAVGCISTGPGINVVRNVEARTIVGGSPTANISSSPALLVGFAAAVYISGGTTAVVERVLAWDLAGGNGNDNYTGTSPANGGDAAAVWVQTVGQAIIRGVSAAQLTPGQAGNNGGPPASPGITAGVQFPESVGTATIADLIVSGADVCVSDPDGASTVTDSILHACGVATDAAVLDATVVIDDPLFVDPVTTGDLHLQVSSPGIDTGTASLACSDEPAPNGCRANMGFYGGTVEATSAPAANHCAVCP